MGTIERYAAPRTLEEAAELLRGGDATIFAGGTDVTPQTKAGKLRWQPLLMNIGRIAGLRDIREEQGAISIGALTTVTDLMESALIRARFRILWQACDQFASDQIRNAATLGGNICNASPAGDMLVPLLVSGAEIRLVSKPNGTLQTRTLPLERFFAGPGRTHRLPQELLVSVTLPLPARGFRGEFLKFGTRPALDISTVSIGVGAVIEGGRWCDVRIAFGAVAPTPIRAPGAEQALAGRELGEPAIAAAVRAADEALHPISDVRASEWYRRELVHNMLRRVLRRVAEA